jgi:sigma-B regulation protein RsbU (phosphoserine phosphatase)
MARSERLAVADDERAAGLGRIPVRDTALSRALSPVNDIGSEPRGRVAFDDIDGRMQHAFERKLLGPLSQVIETAVMLEQQLDGVQAGQVRAVTAAARRQQRMLRDVLAFVQTSMWGRIRVRRRRVDLRLLCERFFDAFQGRHPDYAIALVTSKNAEGNWDPDLVENLLSHLAANAVEHGDAGKVVRVVVHAAGDDAVIEITSAGPALDEDVVARLFEPFNCGPSERSAESERLGLGLFLANEIAHAHSGRIDVWSDTVRGTNTFRATLPRM